MKKILIFFLLFLLIFSLSILVYAHSGGTDGSGGHYDHSTGDYHYHHGYPAHNHPNGKCPYANSGTTSTNNDNAFGLIITLIIVGLFVLFIIWVYFPRNIFKKLNDNKIQTPHQKSSDTSKTTTSEAPLKVDFVTPHELRDSVELLKRLMDERNLAYSDDSDIIWYFEEDLPLKELTEKYANQVIDNFLKSVENND